MGRCASVVGIPILVDLATVERQGSQFARICVEVLAKHGFPEQGPASSEDDSEWVSVAYEWKPVLCTNYCSFGHVDDACPTRPSNAPSSSTQLVCTNIVEPKEQQQSIVLEVTTPGHTAAIEKGEKK